MLVSQRGKNEPRRLGKFDHRHHLFVKEASSRSWRNVILHPGNMKDDEEGLRPVIKAQEFQGAIGAIIPLSTKTLRARGGYHFCHVRKASQPANKRTPTVKRHWRWEADTCIELPARHEGGKVKTGAESRRGGDLSGQWAESRRKHKRHTTYNRDISQQKQA